MTQALRARYIDVEELSRDEESVLVRTADQQDLTLPLAVFDLFYVPVHTTTVEFGGGASGA